MEQHSLESSPPRADPAENGFVPLTGAEATGREHVLENADKHSSRRTSSAKSYQSNSTDYAYDHETFETFQHKVHALASELGVIFEDVQRISGSGYNRFVAITLQNPPDDSGSVKKTQAILRIPRVSPRDGDEEEIPEEPPDEDDGSDDTASSFSIDYAEEAGKQILDEVALFNHLAESAIPVPRVLAYDSTCDNALRLPYSIHVRIPGVPLDDVFDKMSLEDKIRLAGDLAELMVSVEKVQFHGFGRPLCKEDKDSLYKLPLDLQNPTRSTEKVVLRGFLKGTAIRTGRDLPSERVYSHLYRLLFFHLEHVFRHEVKSKDKDPFEEAIRAYLNLKDMLTDMEQIGLITDADKTPQESVLYLSYLEPGNLIVEQIDGSSGPWKITGLLDWHDADVLPPVLTKMPPVWLWDSDEEATFPQELQDYYDGDFDYLPLEYYKEENHPHLTSDGFKIKKRFEEVIVEKLYRDEFKEQAAEKYYDDAYGRGRWIRRLSRYAFDGMFETRHLKRFKTLHLEWAAYKKSIGYNNDDSPRPNGVAVYATASLPSRCVAPEITKPDDGSLQAVTSIANEDSKAISTNQVDAEDKDEQNRASQRATRDKVKDLFHTLKRHVS